MNKKTICASMGIFCLLLASCTKIPEMTLEEIELHSQNLNAELIEKTLSKPWTGQIGRASCRERVSVAV